MDPLQAAIDTPMEVREEVARYGSPTLSFPRLGQGSFRIIVTDAYNRRWAVTNERTLPALDAAHIKPYSGSGKHSVRWITFAENLQLYLTALHDGYTRTRA